MDRINLTALSKEKFDVVVIGAGINGSAAAQKLSADGYRTLIIDKGDFGQGATSQSSRILHCGLRYLTPGTSAWEYLYKPADFVLACKNARKSMQARKQIIQTLGDLVKPFEFCFPIYRKGPYKRWQIDSAFSLLARLGPEDSPLGYRRFNKKTLHSVAFASWMRDQNHLLGMAVFQDYQFLSAERLVIDSLVDSARLGSVVRNYTQCHSAQHDGERWLLDLSDTISDEKVTVKAKLVINSAGPWGDALNHNLTGDTRQRMVGLKGIHILVQLPEPLSGRGMMTITRNQETLYCLPWHGLHYIGPTRTPYGDNLDDVFAHDEDIQWVLDEINYAMPRVSLTRRDVLYSWAGIQPVTYDPAEPKGSRQVKIHDLNQIGKPNMLMLTGGPIITYRVIAEQLAAEVKKRIAPTGAKGTLSYRASSMSDQVIALGDDPSLSTLPDDIIKTITQEEQVLNLSDFYFRRTSIGWSKNQGVGTEQGTAQVMSEVLGWSEEETQRQIRGFQHQLHKV